MTNKIAVLAMADPHSNSTVAVCPPFVNKDDGGTYRASRVQRWLWDVLLDIVDRFSRVQADEKIANFVGDLGELDTKRRSNQLITFNKATALNVSRDVLEPVVDITDRQYFFRGTPAHTGKSAWFEEELARDFDSSVPEKWKKNAFGEPEKVPASWYHLRGNCAGVLFDIAHHTSMGGMPWTERHAAMKMVEKAMWRYAFSFKQKLPDVMIRAHNHRFSDSGSNYPIFGVTLPALTIATEYVYRIGKENDLSDIGAVVFICEDGKYTFEKWIYEPKGLNRIWALKM